MKQNKLVMNRNNKFMLSFFVCLITLLVLVFVKKCQVGSSTFLVSTWS